MSNPPRRDTAKIYRFPTRMRLTAIEAARADRDASARLYAMCDYGSGWYHEAAIQDDLRGRKP